MHAHADMHVDPNNSYPFSLCPRVFISRSETASQPHQEIKLKKTRTSRRSWTSFTNWNTRKRSDLILKQWWIWPTRKWTTWRWKCSKSMLTTLMLRGPRKCLKHACQTSWAKRFTWRKNSGKNFQIWWIFSLCGQTPTTTRRLDCRNSEPDCGICYFCKSVQRRKTRTLNTFIGGIKNQNDRLWIGCRRSESCVF